MFHWTEVVLLIRGLMCALQARLRASNRRREGTARALHATNHGPRWCAPLSQHRRSGSRSPSPRRLTLARAKARARRRARDAPLAMARAQTCAWRAQRRARRPPTRRSDAPLPCVSRCRGEIPVGERGGLTIPLQGRPRGWSARWSERQSTCAARSCRAQRPNHVEVGSTTDALRRLVPCRCRGTC